MNTKKLPIARRLIARGLAVLLVLWTAPWAQAEPKENNPTIPVEVIRSDFEALYAGLKRAHVDLYAHRTKAAYDARYQEMLTSFNRPLSLFEVRVAFQKFVAYGNVAHARIEFPEDVYRDFRDKGGRSFPIYPRIAGDHVYVGENYSGNADIRSGDEILALNGEPIANWLARTAAHISADTDYIAHSILEFALPQYLWLELGERPYFDLTLKAQDGNILDVQVKATTRQEQTLAADNQPARFALNGAERTAKMLTAQTAYLRPGPFYNFENPAAVWDNSAFLTFTDDAFETFIKEGARQLIIDLRENPGGDNSFSDPILAWFADRPFRFCSAFLVRSSDEAAASNQARLDANPAAKEGISGRYARMYAETPRGELFDFDIDYAEPRKGERFEGQVYILVNRHSFSNAVTMAAMAQDYGFATIVGEKTSDMATTYGAMESFTLPATGISVGFPKAHIIRPSGTRESDGVTPDWEIPSPIAPTKEDVVLQQLLERLEAKG
ncbi:S41 family peptidase [Kordiimonas lipolytica]|uniref:S41 family peptidase n=1 Tax=Kordiimonas lipolytica TaxID=1662421 RepID=A0ABV8UF51_9PROT